MNIIEYIGKDGVITTPDRELHRRFKNPRPGDVLIWNKEGKYPFHKETYGRFDKFGSWVENKWHVCCEPGSVFLSPDSVSISGGPFTSISIDQIEPTYTLQLVRFWNWGDLGPGAGHGVDYYIERPVFKLKNIA